MNSDLDNNSDVIYHSLMTSLRTDSGFLIASQDDTTVAEKSIEVDDIDPLDLEELNLTPSTNTTESSRQILNFGELPIVESRFQLLLKTRLQAEIERRPPLFPWETEISDYELEPNDGVVDSWVPPIGLWTPQLSRFNLPVPVPEKVLAQLLETCSEVMQTSLQKGAKMVQVVKTLFPEQPQFLNQLAGVVLLYPARSPQAEQLFTTRYEDATPEQQMALSLLAAREMIEALTLEVSANQPPVEKQWQTADGNLTVQAQYQVQQVGKLQVKANLPKGGSLRLQIGKTQTVASNQHPGYLSIESLDLAPNQIYPLEVRLEDCQEQPLFFALKISS